MVIVFILVVLISAIVGFLIVPRVFNNEKPKMIKDIWLLPRSHWYYDEDEEEFVFRGSVPEDSEQFAIFIEEGHLDETVDKEKLPEDVTFAELDDKSYDAMILTESKSIPLKSIDNIKVAFVEDATELLP